jgi:hydrogenase maturation factor
MQEILTVGDFIYDVQAGKSSGALTVYLTNGISSSPTCRPDYTVRDLTELEELISRLRPLPVGKLPNRFLEESLAKIGVEDSQIVIGPRVGEDVAAIQMRDDEEIVVLKSDPITFSTNRLGYYSVVINANDIATSGAKPRWLLATILLPEGANATFAQALIAEIDEFCDQYGIHLCGGHTEITDAVNQPVVIAQIAGTVTRERLLDKRCIGQGDQVLLTKGIAIEGTTTLAHEFPQELLRLGLSEKEILDAQLLLEEPGISILEEARLAAELDGVIAMHDVTEGGIATALAELSLAANRRIQIDPDLITILPETERFCAVLGLDPLGLIGSGSLLIVCRKSAADKVSARLREAGITADILGLAGERGRGVDLANSEGVWPRFETDEIARAFDILNSLKGEETAGSTHGTQPGI